MEEQDTKTLLEIMGKREITHENICKAGTFLIQLSRKGLFTDWVKIWIEHQDAAKGSEKLFYFYLVNEVLQRHAEDNMNLLKAFADIIKQELYKCMLQINDLHVRNEINNLVNIWREQGLFSPSFLDELDAEILKGMQENPAVANTEFGVSKKVKLFAVYFRNYQECKSRIDET